MRRWGIQSKLFVSFTFIVFLVVGMLGYLYYYHTLAIIRERSLETSNQLLNRLMTSLDQTVKDVDRISAQALYSPEIRAYFEDPFPLDTDSFDSLSKRNAYESILASFNGPWFISKQINVFNLQGDFISYGLTSNLYPHPKDRYPLATWIAPTIALKGEKRLNPPHYSEWHTSRDLVFSLSRAIPFPNVKSPSLIEIQQPYSLLEQVAANVSPKSKLSVYIFDQSGHVFLPVDTLKPQEAHLPFDWKMTPAQPYTITQIEENKQGKKYILSFMFSSYSGLIVATLEPKDVIMQPIYQLRTLTLLITVLAGLISLLLSYIVEKTISSPTRLLQKYIRKLDFDNIDLSIQTDTMKLNGEMLELYDAFDKMKMRLMKSMNLVLESQHREKLAHLQAMQSQLNPHFLYNIFSSIGMHAEEMGVQTLADMCYKLTSIMRYISLPTSESVVLLHEVNHTKSYLELMKLRYENRLDYEVILDPELESIQVPRFILQPLVENSFVHGFQEVSPPWSIRICITADQQTSDRWSIEISDNGSGFKPEVLANVQKWVEELHFGRHLELHRISSRGVGGMGMENTLTRCRLFWHNRVRFSVRNEDEGMKLVILILQQEVEGYVPDHDC